MSNIIKWSVLGLLAYLFFLLATLPANQLLNRLDMGKQVTVFDVSGTIWDGAASMLLVNNIAIENVRWETSFWSLLLGKAHIDIQAGNIRESDKVSVSGPVSINLFNPNYVKTSGLTLYVPANMAIAQANLPLAVDATGRFKLEITELDYPGRCLSLQGRGQWLNAGLDGLIGLNEPLSLDNFSADLSCLGDDILVKVDGANVLNLSADVRVPKDLKVSVNGRFKPSKDLPKQVQDATLFFRQTDAQGYHLINL